MKHIFIAIDEQKIDLALAYYDIGIDQRNYDYCFLDDRLILHKNKDKLELIPLFTDIDCYAQRIGNKSKKIDYWGKTIIPPHSVVELRRKLKNGFKLKYTFSFEMRKFVKLVDYATSNNYYIVHIGI